MIGSLFGLLIPTMQKFLLVVCLFVAAGTAKLLKELPPNFPKCYRDDPEISACILKAANDAKPFLIKGVPEMNLPSISPFVVPEVNFEQGTEAINLKATFSNMTFIGLENYQFTKFDFDTKKLEFHCKISFGPFRIVSKYKMEGRILVAPISGSGTAYMNISNAEGALEEKVKLVERNGITFMEPTEVKVKLDIGKGRSYFDGLFDGNEALAKATNDVINENSDELFKETTPAIENVMAKVFENLLANSIAKIPYDVVYPKRFS